MSGTVGMYGSAEERFWRKVVPSENGCWEWFGARLPHGYGNFYFDGERRYAHRYAYELLIGQIPEGMVVCHRCDNPSCVHPSHLFVGTQKDNLRDMQEKGRKAPTVKTHCKRGHDLSVHGKPQRKGQKKRYCVICAREWMREYRRKRIDATEEYESTPPNRPPVMRRVA